MRVTGRDLDEQELALSFNGGMWTILGDATEFAMNANRRAIYDCLLMSGKPLDSKQVAEETALNRNTVKTILGRMLPQRRLGDKYRRPLQAAPGFTMTGRKPVVKPAGVKPVPQFCTVYVKSETRETTGLKPAPLLVSAGFTCLKPGETVKPQTPQQKTGFKSFIGFKGFTGFQGFYSDYLLALRTGPRSGGDRHARTIPCRVRPGGG